MNALTRFLCDLIDQSITKQDMQARWKAGEYRGVKPDYAAWAMKWSRG